MSFDRERESRFRPVRGYEQLFDIGWRFRQNGSAADSISLSIAAFHTGLYIAFRMEREQDVAGDPRELIRRAFFAARDGGKKPDWWEMTAGVLKNRLRQITGGTFDEADYGAHTFTAFLRAFPDLVEIDSLAKPPRVVLKEYAPADYFTPPLRGLRHPRIRRDLWQALVDYSSRIQYVWDQATGKARPRNEGMDEDAPVIPTLTPDELREWRRTFLATNPAAREYAESPQVLAWLERSLGTSALPTSLRGPWNQEMSRLLDEKIRRWFAEQRLQPPADLVEQPPTTEQVVSDTEDLREVALEVIAKMTLEELRGLKFPADAVLRAYRRRG